MRARIAASTRWAKEPDRAAGTAAARAGARRAYEREADPEGVLPPAELEKRVRLLERAHMMRMSLAASKARRAGVAARSAVSGDDPIAAG